ncbi:hypothetical protein V1506DRAFT_523722 [Lipomyces tetrasporus]
MSGGYALPWVTSNSGQLQEAGLSYTNNRNIMVIEKILTPFLIPRAHSRVRVPGTGDFKAWLCPLILGGLQTLCSVVLNKFLPKEAGIRVKDFLSDEIRDYAALDAYIL